jgi:cellulose synthase operon protein C
MSRSAVVRLLLVGFFITVLFTGCSRDPAVRKQKYLESGDRYFEKEKYREAAIQYSNAVQVDSRFAQAHYQLGQTYLKLGDSSRAFQELSRAVELAPDNYRAHIDLANLLVTARNPDGSPNQDYLKQARTHLDLLHEKQPQNPEVFEAWADYYSAQNNLGAALQEIQKAIAADPKRSESYLNLALLQLRSNLPDQAEINFKKAADLDPKAMNAQLALGGFYQSRNRMPEAEQQFKRAIELAPKDPAPREALVRLYMAEGKKSDAEALLKQAKIDLADNPEGYRMLGDFYFASGDIDKATAEYTSLSNEHPKNVDVKRNYIQLLILNKRLDEATKLNNELLKANAHDVVALVYRGQIQLAHNDAAGAVDALQQAIKNDPNNAAAHYQLSIAFDMQHNEARAESELREAVSLNPGYTQAQIPLANLELRRGDLDALMQTAQQIIAGAPQAPEGYMLRALAEMNRQKYSDAQQDLTKAMGLAPGSPAPYAQMGNLYFAQKQYSEAIKFYQQALDKNPASTDAMQGLMNVYVAQKQPDQAIAAARAQIAKSPNTAGFYDLLGTALFQYKKDLSGAEAAFRKAIELDKNNSDALLKLGEVQAAQGSVGQALALYQQSIKDHPRDIQFYILAGEMYESQSDWTNARSMYQKALEIQPDNPPASNNLAYVMLQQGGNVDVALAMAQTARRGMPDSSNAADTLGWAYFQKGVYQSAINLFQEAIRLNEKKGTDDPTVHYHLALAYQKANQPAQARQQLERALKIDPNNQDARKALAQLRG